MRIHERIRDKIRPYQTILKRNDLIDVYQCLSVYMGGGGGGVICWSLNVTVKLLILYKHRILWGLWDKYHDPEYFIIEHIIYYWCLSILNA